MGAVGRAIVRVPWSLSYLCLALASMASLLVLGVAEALASSHSAQRLLPLAVALAPLPFLALGVVHAELPVLLVGIG